jgi:hypothetical protein
VRTPSWIVLAVFVCACIPHLAAAQELSSGQRIRVTAPEVPLVRQPGQLLSFDRQALTLAADSQRWVVPRHLITELEASRGRKGHAVTGLLVGAGVGVVAGLIAIEGGSSNMCTGSGSYAKNCWAVMAGSVGIGALVGGVTGAFIRTERWAVVAPDALPATSRP